MKTLSMTFSIDAFINPQRSRSDSQLQQIIDRTRPRRRYVLRAAYRSLLLALWRLLHGTYLPWAGWEPAFIYSFQKSSKCVCLFTQGPGLTNLDNLIDRWTMEVVTAELRMNSLHGTLAEVCDEATPPRPPTSSNGN